MALLTLDQRKQMFKVLGYGEYNEENILKMQKKNFPQYKTALKVNNWDGKYGTDCDNFLRHEYNVKRYTKNFAPSEFKCDCGGRFCTGYPTFMKPSILSTLQLERDHYGKPMTITSGMRCTRRNKELNGSVVNSRHQDGLAGDHYMQGVTDTLANRRNTLNWLLTTPYFRWGYGNGCNSTGGSPSAPYMGNALHIDCDDVPVTDSAPSTPVEKSGYSGEFPTLGTSQAEICQATSKGKSQWHRTWVYTSKSTSAYHWTRVIRPNKNGDKIAEDMLKAANNGHIKYSKKSNTLYAAASKVGFDCGRITADKNTHCSNLLCVALHYAGFTNAPKSLHAGKAWTYLSKLGFTSLTNTAYTHSPDLLRVGDILQAEGCPHVAVVTKVKGASVLKKGSKGDEVLKLQKYINWFYGKKVVDEDGIFGAGTEKYTKAMQTALGVTPDGIVGSGTLTKMKEYKK